MARLTLYMHRLCAYGGHERTTLEIMTRLAKLGWDIEVVAYQLTDWPTDIPVRWRPIPGKALPSQFLKISWFFFVSGWIATWRAMTTVRAIKVSMGVAAPFADVRIVQFVNTAFTRLVRNKKAPLPNPRTLLHRLYQNFMAWWNAALERQFLTRSDTLICIAESVVRDVKSELNPAPKIDIVVVAHSMGKKLADAETRPFHDPPTILFVGALERKGIDKALRVVAKVADVPWQLIVVGDGDIARWRRLASGLAIADRTTFTGPVPSAPYFAKSSIFLFPSYYEPYGLVVAEAAAHGLAPLCSAECGAMETWSERASWLRLSAGASDDAWADALRKLLQDPGVMRSTAAEAQRAFARWTWDQAAAAYDVILAERLEARR